MIVSCGITLYNPDEQIIEKIREYLNVFDTVYIYDNSETSNEVIDKLKRIFGKSKNFFYLSNGKNMGLPYAFNEILKATDADYLCTLDQDSIYELKEILNMKDLLKTFDNKSKIAIIASKVIYNNEKFTRNTEIIDKGYVITSGSFLNVKIVKKNNIIYDENYFIDKFEIDFGQQLKNLGYRICQYNNSILYQQLGEFSGHRHPNHNVLRHYYLFRNRFYYNNKFIRSFLKRIIITLLQVIRHVILIMLYEENKIKKICTLYFGLLDYKQGRLGKITRRL